VSKQPGPIRIGALVLCLLLEWSGARATVLLRESNIVDLVRQSELILQGTIASVTDGIDDRGLPYTEVTVRVSEVIRGEVGSTYTFRQFGLLKPRSMGNGLVNVMVTPAGWPTYRKGEENILFLNRPAKWTGLQTTVGLTHGQFRVAMGGAVNQADNQGLFAHVAVDSNLLQESDRRVMNTERGAVNAKAFVSLVRKAVAGRWVELGSMRDAQR
jgi:hypothetical protein